MYIVRDKTTQQIIHTNPAPLSQALDGQDVYFQFDPQTMQIGKTDVGSLPEHFKINAAGEIVELTPVEKAAAGLLVLAPNEKIEGEQIVKKTLSEQVAEGLITLLPTQKIDDRGQGEQVVSKTLSEQVAGGLLSLSPTQKIILGDDHEQIVEKPLSEQVAEGLLKLAANQKLDGEQIVEKTSAEMLKENLLTLDEFKQKKIQYFSALSLEKRAALLPDYKLQNALLGLYDDQTVADYKATVQAFRDEFHRLEDLVEKAKTLKKIEAIQDNFPKEIVTAQSKE